MGHTTFDESRRQPANDQPTTRRRPADTFCTRVTCVTSPFLSRGRPRDVPASSPRCPRQNP